MGISYKIDAEAGMVYVVAEGTLEATTFVSFLKDLFADTKFRLGFDMVFDAQEAQLKISGNEAFDRARERQQGRVGKLAIVATESYGASRMFAGWVGDEDRTRVFYDMASAREWLGLPPEEE